MVSPWRARVLRPFLPVLCREPREVLGAGLVMEGDGGGAWDFSLSLPRNSENGEGRNSYTWYQWVIGEHCKAVDIYWGWWISHLGGGKSNIIEFSTHPWGNDPFWRAYISTGLVQPPSHGLFWWPVIFETPKFTESFEQVLIYPQTAGRSMWALMHFLKKQRRCISFWNRLEMWKILVKIPICSMYEMFTYIYHTVEPNVRTISQWLWLWHFRSQFFVEFTSTFGNFNHISSD